MLITLEDVKVPGHSEPLMYLHSNKGIEGSSESGDDTFVSKTTPNLSLSGIFKWLTRQ